jgi:glycine/D-amino acid oxidase-like deaminating enzyme
MWPFRKNSANSIRSSQAFWLVRNGIGDAGPSLQESIECDVAIVGAGITAALACDALVATGQRIVVLDSRDIAQGSTAASTALLQYEIDTHLVELTGMLGAEAAMRAYRACVGSFSVLEQRFPELLPLANYERRPSLYLASDRESVPGLRAEMAARRGIGIACEWLEEEEVLRRFGCRRPGAILSALGAQVDPFRLTRGIFSGCVRHGARLFARTKVARIDEHGDAMRLQTSEGHTVTASHVVVCAGYESLDFLADGLADVNNTFALVTEPLEQSERLAAMPLLWENTRPYLYMRATSDGRLLVGGADLRFKNAQARDLMLPRQIQKLAAQYEELFGKELPPVAYAWAGSFAETRDGLPLIGRVPGRNPRLQFALCFGGNGITFSVPAADMIRAHVEGKPHELDDIFGFGRVAEAAPERRAGAA